MKNLKNYISINEKSEMVFPRPKIEEMWKELRDKIDSKNLVDEISEILTSTEKNKIILELNEKYKLNLI